MENRGTIRAWRRGQSMFSGLCKTSKNFVKTVKFIYFICKAKAFESNRFLAVLPIILKYFELQKDNVKNTVVSGRDVHRSVNLLKNLVCVYEATESSVTLAQILEVLEKEFIKRNSKSVK